MVVKFRNLESSKILTQIDTNRIFPIPFKIMHISLKFRGEPHIDFRTQCVIMMQKRRPHNPLPYAAFPEF